MQMAQTIPSTSTSIIPTPFGNARKQASYWSHNILPSDISTPNTPQGNLKSAIWQNAKRVYASIMAMNPIFKHPKIEVATISFQNIVKPPTTLHPIKLLFQDGYYPHQDGICVVDFANKCLGGGVLKNRGMVQEELMFLQASELGGIQNALVRAHGKSLDIPRRGAIVIGEVLWTIDTHSDMYGSLDNMKPWIQQILGPVLQRDGRNIDLKAFAPASDGISIITEATAPVRATVLAVNAPNLSKQQRPNGPQDYDKYILVELYTRLCAAFSYARILGHTTIYTGRLGCGAFNNNLDVMCSLQCLAALSTQVDLVFCNMVPSDMGRDTIKDIKNILDSC